MLHKVSLTEMSVKFTKNGSVYDSGECSRNLNLLAHAQMLELEIGSRCGGYGECSGDRVKLAEADQKRVNPPTEAELRHLSKDELNSGTRLACQCFPNEDGGELVITIF